jgi:hypothetical protein
VDIAESDLHKSRSAGGADSPATWSRPVLLELVMKSQNIRIKVDDHERSKSQTLEVRKLRDSAVVTSLL